VRSKDTILIKRRLLYPVQLSNYGPIGAELGAILIKLWRFVEINAKRPISEDAYRPLF